jgi:hypothetical protein
MDPRKELSLINKHVRQHNREAGETVMWFERYPFVTAASVGGTAYDDVYDEAPYGPGGRVYDAGIVIPTILIQEVEDAMNLREDGRQPTQNIQVTFLYADALRAGMFQPREYETHLNDVFFYDDKYYKVWDYKVRGRLPSEVIIIVRGYEVYVDQEFVNDPGPPVIVNPDLPWPSTFPGA